jgi:hypothetical protein
MLLYQRKRKAFPEMIALGGKSYAVNMDFRNILRIFALSGDGNIPADKKYAKITEWFFEDGAPPDSVLGNLDFLEMISPLFNKGGGGGGDQDEQDEPQFCYDFDAHEIYAGFLSEYGIDLISVDFLHWHKFRILLENLSPESAFKRKIELRFADLSGHENNGGLIRAKEAVQLPQYRQEIQNTDKSDESDEFDEFDEFNEIWGKAGNN